MWLHKGFRTVQKHTAICEHTADHTDVVESWRWLPNNTEVKKLSEVGKDNKVKKGHPSTLASLAGWTNVSNVIEVRME